MKLGNIIIIGIVAFFVTFPICYAIEDYTLFLIAVLPVIFWFAIEETRQHQKLVDKGIERRIKDLAIKQHRKGELTDEEHVFLKRQYGEEFLNEVLISVSQKQRQKQIYEDEFLEIRTAVLKRDNYTCVNCGRTGGDLHVHHIVPRSEKGANNPDNLVTLCERCHSIQDAKGHKLIGYNERARIFETAPRSAASELVM